MAAPTSAESPSDIPCLEPYHIVKTPGVMSGRARIKGTRIRVMDLVGIKQMNDLTVDQIADDFSHVPRAAIYAAFAYYLDHTNEIEAAYAEDDAYAEAFKAENPDIVFELKR